MFLELRNGGRTLIDDHLFEQPLTIEVWESQFFTFRVCDCAWRHKDKSRLPYVQTIKTCNGRLCCIRLHRLIMSAPKGSVVDHLNHDVLDNRIANLRICTHTENNRNRRSHKRRNGVYTNPLTGERLVRSFSADGKESLLPAEASS